MSEVCDGCGAVAEVLCCDCVGNHKAEVADLRIRLSKAEKDRDRWRSGFRELIKCAVNHAKGMETTK